MNIRELLLGEVVRMRYVKRFGTCRVLTTESVAEHVAFTALYSSLVARWVKRNCPDIKLNVGKLLERALFHDIEEVQTGDLPRPHKHSSPQLALMLEQAAMSCAQSVLQSIQLPPEDTIELFDGWNCAKSDGHEGCVLAFADFLSAISFIAQEILGGNRTLATHVQTCKEYLWSFKKERFKFLAPLVQQVSDVMEEIFDNVDWSKVDDRS